jgi:hypothetical protein
VTGGQFNETGPFAGEGLCSSFSLPHCSHHNTKAGDPYPAAGSKGCPMVEDSPTCPNACDASARAPYAKWKSARYQAHGKHDVQVFQPEDTASIMASIRKRGSVTTSFDVYPDFENYKSGIYHRTTKKESLGGHAVRVVGWGVEGGVKYWKVANSWNRYWGEAGYFRILRGVNECGIEDWMMSSHDDAKWSGPGI